MKYGFLLFQLITSVLLAGCASNGAPNYAPVEDLNALFQTKAIKQVRVQQVGKLTWIWPTTGKIAQTYTPTLKGINIAGYPGEPIVATAAGKVVYSGNGLKLYGNLVIVKHNDEYLSAYAHNRRILVHEGEWVKQGQKIAEMGQSGTDKTMLHFEIRRDGLPLNPIGLLGYNN